MNLKKFFASAAAVVFCSGLVFAQEADEKTIQYTQKAIMQSLAIFDAHNDQNQLNDTDRAIETALNTTLPGIFNRVENPSEELATELENAVTSLAQTLVSYQQLYPANMLDMDVAKMITVQLALTYAAQKNLISEQASQIIMMSLMESMAGDEEE